MRQNRLFKCPGELQGNETDLIALFCFPNTPDWRRTITALVHLLIYGRAWDEATGNVKATLQVAERIVDSMAICDIGVDIARIADGIEAIVAILQSGVPIETTQTDLKRYVDEVEETLQEIGRAIGGVTIPITETP